MSPKSFKSSTPPFYGIKIKKVAFRILSKELLSKNSLKKPIIPVFMKSQLISRNAMVKPFDLGLSLHKLDSFSEIGASNFLGSLLPSISNCIPLMLGFQSLTSVGAILESPRHPSLISTSSINRFPLTLTLDKWFLLCASVIL